MKVLRNDSSAQNFKIPMGKKILIVIIIKCKVNLNQLQLSILYFTSFS